MPLMSEADDALPVSADTISEWCRQRNIPIHEGRQRFMEFVILVCISNNRTLSSGLVFKGGNALRFVYQNPRSTIDLDFTVTANDIPDNVDDLRQLFNQALRWAERRYNVKAKCQSIKRNPPLGTRPTYGVRIGYQFQTDRYFSSFEDRNVSTVIPLEISFFDLVCENTLYTPERTLDSTIRVCTLEDIVAEKLRALLQQPIRNRFRWQDVYDLARIYRELQENLDFTKISEFFLKKCKIREITPMRSSFDERVREMAELDYEKRVLEQAPSDIILFDEAWVMVKNLVDQLDLP